MSFAPPPPPRSTPLPGSDPSPSPPPGGVYQAAPGGGGSGNRVALIVIAVIAVVVLGGAGLGLVAARGGTATVSSAVVVVPTSVAGDAPPVTAGAVPTTVSATVSATGPVAVLRPFEAGGAPAVIGAFEHAMGVSPARLMQVVLYPEYAFASAQDPANPAHIDEYPWRDGGVGAPTPSPVAPGDLEASLFSSTDVDWTVIERLIADAAPRTAVEDGAVTHVIVDRSVFTDDFAVVVRVYVSGPRSSAYVEYTPTGEFITVVS